MRYIVIGRHRFTPVQIQLLQKLGLTEEVARVQQISDVADVLKLAKEKGADAIVIQALPMHLLAQLLTVANRANIPVYGFRIEAVTIVPITQRCPAEADVEIPDPRSGNKRCSKTLALQRLKRIVVEAEDVATV